MLSMADRKTAKLFKGVDMRMPVDIAIVRVRPKKGEEEVVTTESQRKEIRKKYAKNPNIKVI